MFQWPPSLGHSDKGKKQGIKSEIKKLDLNHPVNPLNTLDRSFFIRDRSLWTLPVHTPLVSTLSLVNLYMNVLDKVKRNDNWGDFILMNLILLRLTNLIVRG